jgi:type I restriction enzyme M protein
MAKAKKPVHERGEATTSAQRDTKEKSLETWMWGAASSIRGQKDAAKFKDFILPLVFTKRLCDVYDDELDRIAAAVGSRAKAFRVVAADKALVRFYLPLRPDDPDQPIWSIIRTLSGHIGERLTSILREIADANPLLKGILDRVDFNATTHGVRDLDDDRLSDLIEAISAKPLGLDDVEPDIIGRSYEYLIRKFAEGSGRSAGEFYTPYEVGMVMARIMAPEPGMTVYDPCCGSAGLLIKSQLVARAGSSPGEGGITLYGQENEPGTWAMANMNMIIHDMEGDIQIGDTFRRPKFKAGNRLRTFDRVVANPMWNQDGFKEADYDADELGRFTKPGGYPGNNADWGWLQHILASVNSTGRAAVVMDAGAASRGSGNANRDREKEIRRWFLDSDAIESVLLFPENLFYNTPAAGIVIFLNRAKPELRQGRVLMVNASGESAKAKPKNYLPSDAVDRMVEAITEWREVEGFSRIVGRDEIDDYNIGPSRYVHSATALEYRPLSEVLGELELLEKQAGAATTALHDVLNRLEEKQAL